MPNKYGGSVGLNHPKHMSHNTMHSTSHLRLKKVNSCNKDLASPVSEDKELTEATLHSTGRISQRGPRSRKNN